MVVRHEVGTTAVPRAACNHAQGPQMEEGASVLIYSFLDSLGHTKRPVPDLGGPQKSPAARRPRLY